MARMAPQTRRYAPEDIVMQTVLVVFALVSAVAILGSALAIAWRSASQEPRG
jgi:hypothetical protein